MRIRWFSAQWPFSISTIAQRMKKNNFAVGKDDGFIVDKIRDKSIHGRYVEKFSFQEKIIDPFNNDIFYDRISYQTVDFVLFDEFPNIEILNSPRSTSSYTSKLLEICDFDLSINAIKSDVNKWTENFKKRLNEKITVDCIQINDLEIIFGVKAKILVKGSQDVTAALKSFTEGRKYKIEKIQLKIPFQDNTISINLSDNGSIKIPDIAVDDIMPIIRDSLPRIDS